MATPLDITALQHFEGLWPFLLVLVLVYAFLSKTDWFSERKGMAALIALLAAVMTLFSSIAIKTVNMMAPWFVLFVIFAILFMLAFMMFGFETKDVKDFVGSGGYSIGTWVMAIMLIIGFGSFATVVNEEVGFEGLQEGNDTRVVQEEQEVGFWETLFHPKILGMVLLLLISFFTIQRMSAW